MDKRERMELVYKGIIILRPQFDQHYWKIVKANRNSGWSQFCTGWYSTMADAERKINEIIARDPEQYKKG